MEMQLVYRKVPECTGQHLDNGDFTCLINAITAESKYISRSNTLFKKLGDHSRKKPLAKLHLQTAHRILWTAISPLRGFFGAKLECNLDTK
jgi:hypothetical protein